MSGGEIIPAAATGIRLGKGALNESPKERELLAEIAKDSPAMKAAAASYAQRLAIKQAILLKMFQPFAKWAGASKDYFESEFAIDMADKIAQIPEEHLTAPPISVAVPAMQGLSYSLEDSELKEMYLTLLATATDDRRVHEAHPSFAEIIKQLSPAEARLLAEVLRRRTLPIIQIRRLAKDGRGWTVAANHVIPLTDLDSNQPVNNESLPVWVDNWIRLGLVEVDYDSFLVDPKMYDFAETRPELRALVESDPRGREGYTVQNGILRVTSFGTRFSSAAVPRESTVERLTPDVSVTEAEPGGAAGD